MSIAPDNPPEPHPSDSPVVDRNTSPSPTPSTPRLVNREWFLSLLLCLVVLGIASYTLLDIRLSSKMLGQTQDMDQLIDDTIAALDSTKVAYHSDLVTSPVSPRRKSSGGHPFYEGRVDQQVIKSWRSLATSRIGRAAEWRRLGITLALFHQPGALDALRHVQDHFPKPTSSQRKSSLADPFGHGPVPITPAQEFADWREIYGTQRLTISQVPELRRMLGQLRLGWFENIAAAQLYTHAGLSQEAQKAAQAAARSATWSKAFSVLQIGIYVLGTLGLIVLCLIAIFTAAQKRSSAPHGNGYMQSSSPTPSAVPPDSYRVSITSPDPSFIRRGASTSPDSSFIRRGDLPSSPFPYSVLMQTFLIYLIGQEGIGVFAAFALLPLHHQLEALPVSTRLRLALWLQLLLYAPIVGLPLYTLRRKIAFDPLTGERITLRSMLAHIGFRVNNPLADIGSGVLGYLLVMPAVAVAALFSSLLFAHIHTPINPAELWMLTAQSTRDRVLILLLASGAAPFAEETMFRGILYPALRQRLGIWGGAALSAAIFSAVHPTLPGGFLPIWAVGVGLALVYEWRKSLLPGMVLHSLFNGITTIQIFLVFAR